MEADTVEQALRDYAALKRADADPDLEAVRLAILIEDVFGVTLADTDIDAAVLADASAVSELISRLKGAA